MFVSPVNFFFFGVGAVLLLGLDSLRMTIVSQSVFFLPSLRLFDKCSKTSLDTTRVGF